MDLPPVGSLLRNPALATTLEGIARDGKAGFYRGPVAERLGAFLASGGGHLRAGDFSRHTSTWVEPLSASYGGHDILAFPPNTQGLAQIQLFEMAKYRPINELDHNSSSYLHELIELKKVAFADRDRWVADPEQADIPVNDLLDPAYLEGRASLVDPTRAAPSVAPGLGEVSTGERAAADDSGDTVYLTAVDQWGNAVSWIQSLFAGFGSGLFEPETGIMLQNRGSLFALEEGHPNRVAPGKRPYHTLSPLLALRDGRLAFTLGTPGGDSQPQSLLQIVNNLLLFGMTPQEAIEAPRFRSYPGLRVAIEDRVSPAVREELAALGHELRVVRGWTATFGGAQMILVEPGSGTLAVGSDPRREAYGLAY
ncbi:MAG: gamma-glutamyltransferase [Gemmatimonadota bacterium]